MSRKEFFSIIGYCLFLSLLAFYGMNSSKKQAEGRVKEEKSYEVTLVPAPPVSYDGHEALITLTNEKTGEVRTSRVAFDKKTNSIMCPATPDGWKSSITIFVKW